MQVITQLLDTPYKPRVSFSHFYALRLKIGMIYLFHGMSSMFKRRHTFHRNILFLFLFLVSIVYNPYKCKWITRSKNKQRPVPVWIKMEKAVQRLAEGVDSPLRKICVRINLKSSNRKHRKEFDSIIYNGRNEQRF